MIVGVVALHCQDHTTLKSSLIIPPMKVMLSLTALCGVDKGVPHLLQYFQIFLTKLTYM